MTFPDLLKSWGLAMGLTRKQQAAALFVPIATLDGWHDGRAPRHEELLRFVIAAYMDGKLKIF